MQKQGYQYVTRAVLN